MRVILLLIALVASAVAQAQTRYVSGTDPTALPDPVGTDEGSQPCRDHPQAVPTATDTHQGNSGNPAERRCADPVTCQELASKTFSLLADSRLNHGVG